jgi:hypothetical protein
MEVIRLIFKTGEHAIRNNFWIDVNDSRHEGIRMYRLDPWSVYVQFPDGGSFIVPTSALSFMEVKSSDMSQELAARDLSSGPDLPAEVTSALPTGTTPQKPKKIRKPRKPSAKVEGRFTI